MRGMLRLLVCMALGLAAGASAAPPALAQESDREPSYARGDTSSFWLSDDASADSLEAFWGGLHREWLDELPETMAEFGLEEFRVDSLQAIGDVKLQELVAGTLWRHDFQWLTMPDYNRVQGPVARVGWSLHKVGPNRPVFRIQGGYAFANKRPVGKSKLEWPLLSRRWNLSGGRGLGREYKLLALEITALKDAARFAGDDRRLTRTLSALLYGSDPNHYFEERRVDARLNLRITRGSSMWLGAGYGQERSLQQEMDFNLFGRDPSPDGNRLAEQLNARRLAGGAELDWRWLHVDAEASLWRAEDSAFMDSLTWTGRLRPGEGSADYASVAANAQLELLDGLGNRWLVRGGHRWQDKPAPRQWRTWLGDYNETEGMLRGYEAGELSGEIAHSASVDLRLNFDLFRTMRVPLLGRMGIQPVLFADWAKTRNQEWMGYTTDRAETADPLALELGEGAQDWRANVGFGFAVPGLEPVSAMRFYVARPVGEGSGERDWRVLFAFER